MVHESPVSPRRREFPARLTRRAQVFVQNRFVKRMLEGSAPQKLPPPLELLRRWPFLRRIPARFVGVGIRPEHVRQ